MGKLGKKLRTKATNWLLNDYRETLESRLETAQRVTEYWAKETKELFNKGTLPDPSSVRSAVILYERNYREAETIRKDLELYDEGLNR